MKMELAHLKINHHIELNKLFISRKYNANQTDQETSQAKPSQSVPEFHLNSITMSIFFLYGINNEWNNQTTASLSQLQRQRRRRRRWRRSIMLKYINETLEFNVVAISFGLVPYALSYHCECCRRLRFFYQPFMWFYCLHCLNLSIV